MEGASWVVISIWLSTALLAIYSLVRVVMASISLEHLKGDESDEGSKLRSGAVIRIVIFLIVFGVTSAGCFFSYNFVLIFVLFILQLNFKF